MKAVYEFRIGEDVAHLLFADSDGTKLYPAPGLPAFTRAIRLADDDPRLAEVGLMQKRLRAEQKLFFAGWDIVRRYTREEVAEAQWWHLIITTAFEPTGEECGTEYSDALACKQCTVGTVQVGRLILSRSSFPRGKDVARTIGGELVISNRLVMLLQSNRVTGAEFDVLFDRSGREIDNWKQFKVLTNNAEMVPPTVAGSAPFDLDEAGEHRCLNGHVIGLNLLSEIYFTTEHKADILQTRQATGWRMGLLRPEHRIIVSKRVATLLRENKVRGCRLEIAHLIDDR